jgi:hypothetical protein
MSRLRLCIIASLAVGLGAASRNWLAAPEFHYSPVPRERHGKSGVAQAKRKARKHRRGSKHARRY